MDVGGGRGARELAFTRKVALDLSSLYLAPMRLPPSFLPFLPLGARTHAHPHNHAALHTLHYTNTHTQTHTHMHTHTHTYTHKHTHGHKHTHTHTQAHTRAHTHTHTHKHTHTHSQKQTHTQEWHAILPLTCHIMAFLVGCGFLPSLHYFQVSAA